MCLWPDPGGRLQEGVSRGAEKIREGSMEGNRVSGSENVEKACVIQKSSQCLQKPFGIHDEVFLYPVIGTLRDAEV